MFLASLAVLKFEKLYIRKDSSAWSQTCFERLWYFCDQLVCMSVDLSVRISQKLHHVQISPNLFTYFLWPWLDPHLTTCNTLCTSSFVDDVMFSHNGAKGPESRKNVMLRRVLRWRHRKRSWCLKLQACCVYVFKACDQFSLYQQQNIWGVARGASRAHSLVNWPTGLDYVLLPGSAWNWPRKAVSSQLVIGSTKWSCVT